MYNLLYIPIINVCIFLVRHRINCIFGTQIFDEIEYNIVFIYCISFTAINFNK